MNYLKKKSEIILLIYLKQQLKITFYIQNKIKKY